MTETFPFDLYTSSNLFPIISWCFQKCHLCQVKTMSDFYLKLRLSVPFCLLMKMWLGWAIFLFTINYFRLWTLGWFDLGQCFNIRNFWTNEVWICLNPMLVFSFCSQFLDGIFFMSFPTGIPVLYLLFPYVLASINLSLRSPAWSPGSSSYSSSWSYSWSPSE